MSRECFFILHSALPAAPPHLLLQEFKDGIVNGAQWYPVYGGMQDWNYLAAGCMDITLELTDDKWRPEADLTQLWEENKQALTALPLAAALGGEWLGRSRGDEWMHQAQSFVHRRAWGGGGAGFSLGK